MPNESVQLELSIAEAEALADLIEYAIQVPQTARAILGRQRRVNIACEGFRKLNEATEKAGGHAANSDWQTNY